MLLDCKLCSVRALISVLDTEIQQLFTCNFILTRTLLYILVTDMFSLGYVSMHTNWERPILM